MRACSFDFGIWTRRKRASRIVIVVDARPAIAPDGGGVEGAGGEPSCDWGAGLGLGRRVGFAPGDANGVRTIGRRFESVGWQSAAHVVGGGGHSGGIRMQAELARLCPENEFDDSSLSAAESRRREKPEEEQRPFALRGREQAAARSYPESLRRLSLVLSGCWRWSWAASFLDWPQPQAQAAGSHGIRFWAIPSRCWDLLRWCHGQHNLSPRAPVKRSGQSGGRIGALQD
jgi:hypothetical protein